MTTLSTLRRPRLLIRAAKFGTQEYNRDRHLQRLFGYGTLPTSGAALMKLLDMERELNDQRRDDGAAYSLARHLDVLIAILGEAQLYQASCASLHA
ncbi:DUF6477 family protein [Ruegeria sediminis]